MEDHSALLARPRLRWSGKVGDRSSNFTEVAVAWAAAVVLVLLLAWGLWERVEGRRMEPLQPLAGLLCVLALGALLCLAASCIVGLGLGLGLATRCYGSKIDQAFLVPGMYHLVFSLEVVTVRDFDGVVLNGFHFLCAIRCHWVSVVEWVAGIVHRAKHGHAATRLHGPHHCKHTGGAPLVPRQAERTRTLCIVDKEKQHAKYQHTMITRKDTHCK